MVYSLSRIYLPSGDLENAFFRFVYKLVSRFHYNNQKMYICINFKVTMQQKLCKVQTLKPVSKVWTVAKNLIIFFLLF